MTRFEDSKRAVWPEIALDQVPIQIAQNEQQIDAYHDYLKATGFKAFAVGRDGSWGAVSGKLNETQARFSALNKCSQHAAGGEQCELVDVNHQAMTGRVKIILPEKESVDLTDAPMLQSDKRSKTMACPFFADRWEEYFNASRNKAFAVNSFGAMGMVVEEAALSTCETYNQLQKNNGLPSAKTAQFYIIAVNNFFDADTIKLVEQQK